MFTIILGVNPINMSSVDRSAANIMRAIVEFLPGGNLITRVLDKYDVFTEAAEVMKSTLDTLSITGQSIKDAIDEFLDSLGWTQEGTLREAFYNNGEYVDLKSFGILKREFMNR